MPQSSLTCHSNYLKLSPNSVIFHMLLTTTAEETHKEPVLNFI